MDKLLVNIQEARETTQKLLDAIVEMEYHLYLNNLKES